MSPQIVRKFTFWKKSSTKKEIDGLGEAVPGVGGFMKAAGGIFVALLQPLQVRMILVFSNFTNRMIVISKWARTRKIARH
ncbi:hypothetical protein M422DRAFT_247412 [Sphaerobolus stellatus SS14]|nr:hypothetical protein M422DRAFT_247412 [Sphaerobolus stellatus SS14]